MTGFLHPSLEPAIRKLQESLAQARRDRDTLVQEMGKRDQEMRSLAEEQRSNTEKHRNLNAEIHGYEMALRELVPRGWPWR